MSNCCHHTHHQCSSGASGEPSQCPSPEHNASMTQASSNENLVKTRLRIMQMDCPVEERLIRQALGGLSQVKALEFNLIQRVLVVVHEPEALASVLAEIRKLGFEPEPLVGNQSAAQSEDKPNKKIVWRWLAVAGVVAFAAEAMHWLGMPIWYEAALALVAIAISGLSTYRKGWIALCRGDLNINALMSIAVMGALAIGQWPEAAMVMVLFTLSERIEEASMSRARRAIGTLMQLSPEKATVQQHDGRWLEVAVDAIAVEAIVRVKPGERIALDGVVSRGQSTVNQASMTGESLPVNKQMGDTLFAGTINGEGELEYRVTASADNTMLARMIQAVEAAQSAKAPMQRVVDRFAQIYTPAVCALAVAIAILPPLLAGLDWQEWIYKALVLLVIACPCALVISTPVTIVSGLTNAARRGILIKGGVYLEAGRKLSCLALDKTGTVTHGKPVQTDRIIYAGIAESEGDKLAASLVERSDHPVSRAVAAAAQAMPRYDVEAFSSQAGYGVQGTIDNVTYRLGNRAWIEAIVSCPTSVVETLEALEKAGKTVILLCDPQRVIGLYAVADTIKESSREAVEQLHRLGIRTVMLSGDNAHTAQAIAAQVGIEEVRSEQRPEDKLNAVAHFAQSGCTGMVGDGINDAPALAQADIGFAMGAMGTDSAIETADVALMDDDLRKIPAFIRLSQRTYHILLQNIVLAIGIKVLFLILTIMGIGTMWMAVFADVGSSLLVIANGLRLLVNKKESTRSLEVIE